MTSLEPTVDVFPAVIVQHRLALFLPLITLIDKLEAMTADRANSRKLMPRFIKAVRHQFPKVSFDSDPSLDVNTK